MKYFFVLLMAFSNYTMLGQEKTASKSTGQFAEAGFGFGSSKGSFSAAYNYLWYLGKEKRFFVGTGLRFTGFYGTDIDFISAPASLAGKPANEDTLIAANPGLYAINAFINLGYKFSKKLLIGFNIDATGVSFGPEGKPVFKSNGISATVSAKPTAFNLLLIGNNDRGTLNSEFYLHYNFSNKLSVKGAYQYLFAELTTNSKIQTAPILNDRFRHKASLASVGMAYHF